MLATIDLGESVSVSEIGISFLQKQAAWIFFPKRVTIEISEDGRNFEIVKEVTIETEASPAYEIREIKALKQIDTQFVRVTAENVSVCPEWHPGAGGDAWIFVDEIVVK